MNNAKVRRWLAHDPWPHLPSPFGLTATGLQDFCGAPLSNLRRIEDITVRNADFSAANMQNVRFTRCCFENCIFKRADMRHVVIDSSEFRNCRFQKTDFRRSQIGIAGTDFDQCIFEGAQMREAGFHNAVFQNMIFNGRDWKGIDFGPAGFWDCIFNGKRDGTVLSRRLSISDFARIKWSTTKIRTSQRKL